MLAVLIPPDCIRRRIWFQSELSSVPTRRVSRRSEADSGCLNMSKDWFSAVQDAIHETDPQMVEVKIRIAEAAIFNRIHDFSASSGSLEEQAMFDALGSIRILRSSGRLSE